MLACAFLINQPYIPSLLIDSNTYATILVSVAYTVSNPKPVSTCKNINIPDNDPYDQA